MGSARGDEGRRTRAPAAVPVAAVVLVATALALTGCSATVVPGAGRAAAPVVVTAAPDAADPRGPGAGTGPEGETGSDTGPDTGSGPDTGTESDAGTAGGTAAPRPAVAADVLADECLLDALAFSALLDEPVLPPRQMQVTRADGSRPTSCVAVSTAQPPEPLASINVYGTRTGTPADFVRSAPPQGRRTLDGAGEAAALVDTAPGVTLQLAGARYVVTIAVIDGTPGDDTWRAAAAAALAALPT